MFTGIVEDVGKIISKRLRSNVAELMITSSKIIDDLSNGDSVAVNGVCLTVTSVDDERKFFSVDVVRETLSRTNLGELTSGSMVNLERALSSSGRIGGHFVLGHVDGVGRIERWERNEGDVRLFIRAPGGVEEYLVEKGFVAVDGVSLTIVDVSGSLFSVALIPFTLENTVLKYRNLGDKVNIEADILGKYVVKVARSMRRSGITMEFLKERGFL